ncbi:biopolymer transport protein TolQ [Legionella geestiana]|uniref:Tol-Pal system protein TolQ n=1 Tax=Legionella geestiana TaxID=45065 RepID=A0A0W0TNF7_9GAMM|nr:protein TolQ [Legionella geestiana]KTC97138.1 biopolymer transport protein TolQ [Legionella geestiana]QBS11492.1 protein TolQ [Legionella geestiana]QDQ39052.1 protein TolQ [Legionella geestiana]STX53844.1 biopolymer transport protein TolQ [Legionella geestiana]
MANHAGIIGYFFQAGPVVKAVMFLLLCASIASWTLIFQRALFFRQKKAESERFEHRFWESGDLGRLYGDLDARVDERHGLAAIFYAGFREFIRCRKQGNSSLESIERAMQIGHAKEAQQLEAHLPLFASIGSISPYVGLFGTVWGIMTSFQALGHAQQATIAMVAPGISEALVATALGLFTAIPAVIAYNRYSTQASTLLGRYDVFEEELLALIEQQSGQPAGGQ